MWSKYLKKIYYKNHPKPCGRQLDYFVNHRAPLLCKNNYECVINFEKFLVQSPMQWHLFGNMFCFAYLLCRQFERTPTSTSDWNIFASYRLRFHAMGVRKKILRDATAKKGTKGSRTELQFSVLFSVATYILHKHDDEFPTPLLSAHSKIYSVKLCRNSW